MNEPTLKKAMDTLEFLSQDREARLLYEARQKALHDEASLRFGALEEGRAQGRAEGEAEAKRAVAQTMLQKGMSVSLVSEVTGLSEAEVEKLKTERH